MLQIQVLGSEYYDEYKNEFIEMDPCTLQLEHSLASLSKWESKWHKPFLGDQNRSTEESLDYVRCMTINEVDPAVYDRLTIDNISKINEYIEDRATATWFRQMDAKYNRDIITAEIVYHWMISLQIPFECDQWHFNRLLTLIKVCDLKNSSDKRKPSAETIAQRRAINAARLAEL